MPRWASRITLEIINVKIERLRDISEEDAKAEGGLTCCGHCETPYRHGFEILWDSINGKKHPWADNPWVFVVSFRMVG